MAGNQNQSSLIAFICPLTCSALIACDHFPRAACPLNVTVLARKLRTLLELSGDVSFRESAVDLKAPKVVPAGLMVELQWKAMLMVGYGLALLNCQRTYDCRKFFQGSSIRVMSTLEAGVQDPIPRRWLSERQRNEFYSIVPYWRLGTKAAQDKNINWLYPCMMDFLEL